jgi:hypothetical protein
MGEQLHLPFFLLTLSLLFVHELDAVRCREWRIFPLTAFLDDTTGMRVFILAHVPLFAIILFYASRSIGAGGNGFSLGMAIFCVVHAFVHWAYERHPKCEFRNPLSRAIIWSCAGAGLAAALVY